MFGPLAGEARTDAARAWELVKQNETQGILAQVPELLLVANALCNSGLMSDCLEVVTRANGRAIAFDDKVVALRLMGAAHLALSDIPDGRRSFAEADALKADTTVAPQNVMMQRYSTNIFWAQSEANVGNVPAALARLDVADQIVNSMTVPQAMKVQLRTSTQKIREQLSPAP